MADEIETQFNDTVIDAVASLHTAIKMAIQGGMEFDHLTKACDLLDPTESWREIDGVHS